MTDRLDIISFVLIAFGVIFITTMVGVVITSGINQDVKVAPDNTIDVDAWGMAEGLDVYYIEDSNVTCFIYTCANKAGMSCLAGDYS